MNAPRPKLDIDATRERLVALGCSHAAEQLDPMLSEAVRTEVPPHAFLDTLLQAELSGREARRVKTSLRLSNLPVGQTLENFDFAFHPRSSARASTPWPPCAWVRNADTVLVQGPPGVGKTHLLVGLGIRAVEQGFSVQYFRVDELMTALVAGFLMVAFAWRVRNEREGARADRAAHHLFAFSIIYLFVLFAVLLVEGGLGGW